jgi:hypothetical protein
LPAGKGKVAYAADRRRRPGDTTNELRVYDIEVEGHDPAGRADVLLDQRYLGAVTAAGVEDGPTSLEAR